MALPPLYRTLLPDAPANLHSEASRSADPAVVERLLNRTALAREGRTVTPGLQEPALVSSYAGTIDEILLMLPHFALGDDRLSAGYKALLANLRPGTRFVIVHHERSRDGGDDRKVIEGWLAEALRSPADAEFVAMPDFVHFSDWAEDAFAAVLDGRDGSRYLVEPWQFLRDGDALVGDAVGDVHGAIRTTQAPLIFQGGNCLAGDTFWFLGRDYYEDTVTLFRSDGSPVPLGGVPEDGTFAVVRDVFARYLDAGRLFSVVGTDEPMPIRPYYGVREGGGFFLDMPTADVGTFQPIFHIDMFVTLVGRNDAGGDGRFVVLVGSPRLGAERTGRTSPYALDAAYDEIATLLANADYDVPRIPLVHEPHVGRQEWTLAQLAMLGKSDQQYADAVGELKAAGATPQTVVRARGWHHLTWNNCLVENSERDGRTVYLPTYGTDARPDLRALDQAVADLWRDELGFAVKPLGDFTAFAVRQGVVHCIKKYLRRGS